MITTTTNDAFLHKNSNADESCDGDEENTTILQQQQAAATQSQTSRNADEEQSIMILHVDYGQSQQHRQDDVTNNNLEINPLLFHGHQDNRHHHLHNPPGEGDFYLRPCTHKSFKSCLYYQNIKANKTNNHHQDHQQTTTTTPQY